MTTQIGQLDLNRTYTAEEFEALALPDDGKRYELIEGKLIEMAPGYQHGWISKIIFRELTLFDPREKLGEMLPGTSVKLGSGYVFIPDLAYIVASRIPKQRSKKALDVIPDLVVEVHSPSDLASQPERDAAQKKIRRYQLAGVKIVWAINPATQTVEVYHPDQIKPVAQLGPNEELDGENIIPGFQLKIKLLFE